MPSDEALAFLAIVFATIAVGLEFGLDIASKFVVVCAVCVVLLVAFER